MTASNGSIPPLGELDLLGRNGAKTAVAAGCGEWALQEGPKKPPLGGWDLPLRDAWLMKGGKLYVKYN